MNKPCSYTGETAFGSPVASGMQLATATGPKPLPVKTDRSAAICSLLRCDKQKDRPHGRSPFVRHFSWVETLLKVVFKLPPSVFTATMMTAAMPAAIRPYSIAVAPD